MGAAYVGEMVGDSCVATFSPCNFLCSRRTQGLCAGSRRLGLHCLWDVFSGLTAGSRRCTAAWHTVSQRDTEAALFLLSSRVGTTKNGSFDAQLSLRWRLVHGCVLGLLLTLLVGVALKLSQCSSG